MAGPQIRDEPKPPFPKQHLRWPGLDSNLKPRPRKEAEKYRPAGKLKGKRALITGGDSGIGAAVAILYAREGADVAITHLPTERMDAAEVERLVKLEGRQCLLIEGDLTEPEFCERAVEKTVEELGAIDILVSNAGYQKRKSDLSELTPEEWDLTFKTNIYAYYYLVRAAVPHRSVDRLSRKKLRRPMCFWRLMRIQVM